MVLARSFRILPTFTVSSFAALSIIRMSQWEEEAEEAGYGNYPSSFVKYRRSFTACGDDLDGVIHLVKKET